MLWFSVEHGLLEMVRSSKTAGFGGGFVVGI